MRFNERISGAIEKGLEERAETESATTLGRVLRVLAEEGYQCEPDTVLGSVMDSLDAVEVAMALEDEFGCTIDDDEIYAAIRRGTAADLSKLVDGK